MLFGDYRLGGYIKKVKIGKRFDFTTRNTFAFKAQMRREGLVNQNKEK